MIAPLRQRHRQMFTLLAVALPLLLGGSLLVQDVELRAERLPDDWAKGRVPIAAQPSSPDPLLYWSESEPVVGESLPQGARFVGALRSSQWLRGEGPGTALASSGVYFVYSLIDQEVTRIVERSELTGGTR